MSASGHQRTSPQCNSQCPLYPRKQTLIGHCRMSTLRSIMAKSRIETDIDINAPASQVWGALLTDFARMPSWNPFIKSISGNLVQGARLAVHIAPPGSSGMHFQAPDRSFSSARARITLVGPSARARHF